MPRGFILHTPDEIRRIRVAAHLTALARDRIAEQARPGMSTKELDDIAGAIIRSLGGKPAFLGYCGYPANICISVNDEVVHGIASPDRFLLKGDVVSIDVGVSFDGAMGDTAKTICLCDDGPVPDDTAERAERHPVSDQVPEPYPDADPAPEPKQRKQKWPPRQTQRSTKSSWSSSWFHLLF